MTTLVAFAMLAGAVLMLAGRAPGLFGSRRLVKRARSLRRGETAVTGGTGPLIKRAGQSRLDAALQRFMPKREVLRARLEATGLPITIGQYGAVCAGLTVVGTAAGLMLGVAPALALLGGVAEGLFLPHAAIGFLMGLRRAKFLKVFAEAIGLIVRGLRAGLPVTETIGVVGREIADPVGEEFRRVAEEVRLGMSIEDAMWRAARRVNLPEFNFLVISLSVQRETGGNLAETLENLEHILRRRQQMRLKIKAMASEATASALIIGSLPFVMGLLMSMFSPDYLGVLFTEPLGRVMLAGGAASLLAGGVIMRQMVRFEI